MGETSRRPLMMNRTPTSCGQC